LDLVGDLFELYDDARTTILKLLNILFTNQHAILSVPYF